MTSHHLTYRIFIGMLLGIAIGALLRPIGAELAWIEPWLVDGLLQLLGQLFIASLKMLVVPLILVSLICGICGLGDASALGRIGGRAIAWYLLTTAMAISLALLVASLLQPGAGMAQMAVNFTPAAVPPLGEVLLKLVPDNPFAAMASGNTLQVIVFALLFGIAMLLAGEPGQRLRPLFADLNNVILRLVMLLMQFAPVGVMALMAKLFYQQSVGLIMQLLAYFGVVLLVLVLHVVISYGLLLRSHGISPWAVLKRMRDVLLVAFTTASSNATLPLTLTTATAKLGINPGIASFSLPLGATINMDGTAIMQGVATVFIAQVYGVDLSLGQYLLIITTATLASIGTAGVPGVGLVMLALVLQQVGLPVEAIGMIIGVDRLLDMTRTVVNVSGDIVVSLLIARSEEQLAPELQAGASPG